MKESIYHSLLRVSSLTLSLLLLFVSGIISPVTSKLSSDTSEFVAQVMNASAGVTPTDLNLVTAALTTQQAELDARERQLKERELVLGIDTSSAARDYSSWILSALLFVLLVLIVLNYILDFLRGTPIIPSQKTTIARV